MDWLKKRVKLYVSSTANPYKKDYDKIIASFEHITYFIVGDSWYVIISFF